MTAFGVGIFVDTFAVNTGFGRIRTGLVVAAFWYFRWCIGIANALIASSWTWLGSIDPGTSLACLYGVTAALNSTF